MEDAAAREGVKLAGSLAEPRTALNGELGGTPVSRSASFVVPARVGFRRAGTLQIATRPGAAA